MALLTQRLLLIGPALVRAPRNVLVALLVLRDLAALWLESRRWRAR